MPRVKICGLRRERDLQVAAAAGADAVGFICDVDVETDREVDPSRAAELAERTPPFVTTVLVTMPDTVDEAVELAERVRPDAIQIHADFTPTAVAELGTRTDCDVLVAIDVAATDRAHDLEGSADALLVDSLAEGGAGGTGETHDWGATYDLVTGLSTPVVLAGGLTPDNVAAAIDTARPMGVDVSSGVEISGDEGVKDDDAIRAFVENAGRTLSAGAA